MKFEAAESAAQEAHESWLMQVGRAEKTATVRVLMSMLSMLILL